MIGAVGALAAVLLLEGLRPERGSALARLWLSDVSSAATALQAVAATSVTVTTLTFSVTVVTLQLASQQFSPRLLRRFARDRPTKTVLTVLTVTYVFTLTTLSFLDKDRPVPAVAMWLSFALGLVSLATVLGFLTHIVREVRVESMMRAVHKETNAAIDLFYPARTDPSPRSPDTAALQPGHGVAVRAHRSGFLRLIDTRALVRCAATRDVFLRLDVRCGDLITAGTPIAAWWRPPAAAQEAPVQDADLEEAVNAALTIGYERTLEQDVAFGFRQLEDIAVKAMSPAINDPVTASTSVGHMADLLVKLSTRRLGPTVHEDDHGVTRAIVPDRDMRYYLDLACGQLRRYAAGEPTVLIALLRMLRDLACVIQDQQHAAEVRRAADRIADTMSSALSPDDAEQVRDLHRRVLDALDGRLLQAYVDRSGETRSV